MDKNILGRNIKYMREQNGEIQEELGYVVHVSKNTISDYENGRRRPDLETLKKISQYYGKTIDEMLNAQLYELEKTDSTKIVDFKQEFGRLLKILPLIESEKAYENESFSNGILLIKEMINSLERGEDVKGTIIFESVEYFAEAVESDVYEAMGNMLWCIFFLWHQQYTDIESIQKFQERLLSKQVDRKELLYEIKKNEKKSINKKLAFVEDFDEPINELVKELKEINQWEQLGDYYLALRYARDFLNVCIN